MGPVSSLSVEQPNDMLILRSLLSCRLIAVNLSSAFHTMRCAIPAMKKNAGRWGRIINISSVHGVVASINKAAYIASKHGLNGLSKVAAYSASAST